MSSSSLASTSTSFGIQYVGVLLLVVVVVGSQRTGDRGGGICRAEENTTKNTNMKIDTYYIYTHTKYGHIVYACSWVLHPHTHRSTLHEIPNAENKSGVVCKYILCIATERRHKRRHGIVGGALNLVQQKCFTHSLAHASNPPPPTPFAPFAVQAQPRCHSSFHLRGERNEKKYKSGLYLCL